jgi:two-component sensor histidine kinase
VAAGDPLRHPPQTAWAHFTTSKPALAAAIELESHVLARRTTEIFGDLSRAMTETVRSTGRTRTVVREMNHRTMNSFQLLNTVLALEGRSLADPSAKAFVQQAMKRVQAIAMVHRRLLKETEHDVTALDLGAYLRGLTDDTAKAFTANGHVTLNVTAVRGCRIRPDKAMTLGMIVVELILNALKHAFGEGQQGTLLVALEATGGRCHITVADNGRGLPEGQGPGHGVGTHIVRSLIDELDGTLSIASSASGCRITVECECGDEGQTASLPLFPEGTA